MTSISSERSRLWLASRRWRSGEGVGCCKDGSLLSLGGGTTVTPAPAGTVAPAVLPASVALRLRPRPRALPVLFAEPIESRLVLVLPTSASAPASSSSRSRSVPMLRIEPLLGPRVCERTWEGVRISWETWPLGFRRSSAVQRSTSSERPRYAASSRRTRSASKRAGVAA